MLHTKHIYDTNSYVLVFFSHNAPVIETSLFIFTTWKMLIDRLCNKFFR